MMDLAAFKSDSYSMVFGKKDKILERSNPILKKALSAWRKHLK
jgi:hypothetical protein